MKLLLIDADGEFSLEHQFGGDITKLGAPIRWEWASASGFLTPDERRWMASRLELGRP